MNRLKNIFVQIDLLKEAFDQCENTVFPICCPQTTEEGLIFCNHLGALPKEKFLEECKRCRAKIKKALEILIEAKNNF